MTDIKTNRARIGVIDSLRGLAALMVCWHHVVCLNEGLSVGGLIKTTASYGWLGVEIFFVISGFIIPYSLFLANYRLKHFLTFVAKRLVRLDPPYFATIVLVILLAAVHSWAIGFTHERYIFTVPQILLHLGYLNVFFGYEWIDPVFWTLAVEFQFYLLMGLLFPLIASRKGAVRIAVFVALGVLSLMLNAYWSFIFRWLFLFMIGMLVFQYRAGIIRKKAFWIYGIFLSIGLYATLGALIAGVGIATACLIAFVNTKTYFSFLGNISYSLYLVHVPVGARFTSFRFLTTAPFTTKLAFIMLGMGASILAAYIFYRLIEKPAQRWSSSIKYRRDSKPNLDYNTEINLGEAQLK